MVVNKMKRLRSTTGYNARRRRRRRRRRRQLYCVYQN
jgi:hypothetical protein